MRARHFQLLALIVLAGAALRFLTLDSQSFWLDEAATVHLVRRGFGDMLSGISGGESTPPLYYVIAWVWAKLFGTGEVGLRSLSALLGTATIPLVYAIGVRIANRRTGLVAAALAAFNPLLVWYSQEARSYALLMLLGSLSLLAMLSFLQRPATRPLAAWALLSALALATHYYAVFLVAGEALWLLARSDRRRAVAAATAAPVAAGLALLPLALHQRDRGAARFIEESSLARRVAEIPKQFLIGYQSPLEVVATIAAVLLAAYALFRLAATAAGAVRARGLEMLALGTFAVLLPLVVALAGSDYLISRNVIAAWLPLGLAVAAGFAVPRAPREGIAAAAVLCAIGAALTVAVARDKEYQRDDWRGAAEALDDVTVPRAVVVTPPSGRLPMLIYLKGAKSVKPPGVEVAELDFVGIATRLPGAEPHPPRPDVVAAANFTEFDRTFGETFSAVRERKPEPTLITPEVGASPLDGRPGVVLYQEPPG